MDETTQQTEPIKEETKELTYPTYQEIGSQLVQKAKEQDNDRKIEAATNVVSKYIDLLASLTQQKENIEESISTLKEKLEAVNKGAFKVEILNPFQNRYPMGGLKGDNVAQIPGTSNSILIVF